MSFQQLKPAKALQIPKIPKMLKASFVESYVNPVPMNKLLHTLIKWCGTDDNWTSDTNTGRNQLCHVHVPLYRRNGSLV